MPGNLTLAGLKDKAERGEIDTVIVAMVDMQGRLIGKRFHVQNFLDTAHAETHCCNYLLTVDIDMEPVPGYKAASWSKGYGDFTIVPDMETLRVIPWLPATALVLCDVTDHHHHPQPHSPRQILKRQVDRLAEKGMKPFMASELEFYLFDETYESAAEMGFVNLKTTNGYIEDYGILATTKVEDTMRAMRNGLHGAGIIVENSKGEWGAGQEEMNVRYAEAVAMADDHSVMKNGMKEIAFLQGKAITFMAKYALDRAGNSCHVHQSLWSMDGKPLFLDESAPSGMSALMRSYMAGLLTHAREITLFLAPYINSYKRFQQTGTFAPTKAVWSHDNRTAGFRLVGDGSKAIRVECRIGGADLNPYLAFAAMLAAGQSGIEQKLELEEAFSGDAYGSSGVREVPKTLREAIEAARNSDMLKSAFGEEVLEHYIHAAEWEQYEYDRRITDWELKRGFERS
ncbi:putative glutamine synthetase 2 [Hartmannibacter diazotrophicus]|uniref:Putative glutamine synthetase 2 n=1 Tax=Hartmannibacter diazotrophicus TaxID=1482074 RepID=A0A2C9D8Q4_9HYPH|nr:glutamine synthetase family protein [Hartmannibacter diazotrophicus]SON56569.1 putative glutamine synthetase 2 [Hartmannibacter diazotrophicus]